MLQEACFLQTQLQCRDSCRGPLCHDMPAISKAPIHRHVHKLVAWLGSAESKLISLVNPKQVESAVRLRYPHAQNLADEENLHPFRSQELEMCLAKA